MTSEVVSVSATRVDSVASYKDQDAKPESLIEDMWNDKFPMGWLYGIIESLSEVDDRRGPNLGKLLVLDAATNAVVVGPIAFSDIRNMLATKESA